MFVNILLINLNLSSKQLIFLKKNYNISFINKKIIYKNLKFYGNIIFLKNTNNTNFNFKNQLIPILYSFKKVHLSVNKYNKLKLNKTFQKQMLYFIKNFKTVNIA